MPHRRPRQRTQSRASTASIHSINTQPNLDQQALVAHQGNFPDQWVPTEHAQQRDMAPVMQPMPATNMILLRPASQMQVAQSFSMDQSMQPAVGSAMQDQQHQNLHHAVPSESFGANASFTDGESQMMDRDEADEADSLAMVPASRSVSSRTSANNELEMRQLFQANQHRTLPDVARELHGNERGPNSERARQIFAMLWVNQVCSRGKGSVPRGRVYANYASRCATERITVLNPASFGKLVRVLFPGLRTRRLGVRGESKYHYVNFVLAEDQPSIEDVPMRPALPALPYPESTPFTQSFSAPQSQSPALNTQQLSRLPTPTFAQHADTVAAPGTGTTRSHSVYNQPDVNSVDQLHSSSAKTTLYLAFLETPVDPSHNNEPLVLPKIEPYLPDGTDPDAAISLTALYRSHCTSLLECIRFCKDKGFFHLYTSFQGTLTMPVQKLFSNPSIAPWIEQCDFVVYQRMMQIVAPLVLQVIPKPVLETFRNISERLVVHIRESYQGQPRHVVQAKEAPAAIFTALLDRTLRVNLTAHAAANMLANSANRDQMYIDWITMVRIRKVSECVPTRGMDDVVNLLLNEIRDLVDPVNVSWEIEGRTLYGEMALRNSRVTEEPSSADVTVANMLDRWVALLRSLPSRFPYATPEDIVSCVQRVGTEVMRDLTINQSKSFGSWWVTKCWVDEMISFMAEYGGFMKSKISSPPAATVPKHPASPNDTSQPESRVTSGSEEFSMPRVSQPQPDRAPFPSQLEANGQDPLQQSVNHDDSGIGIRTPEEDYPMEKYEY
ncbi:RFX DNA-binding domain-containing protein [Hypoxylon sp. FL0543]|nr:RFX DNA-binding domain-containing protein [Hypoxylon sp. FL0543]